MELNLSFFLGEGTAGGQKRKGLVRSVENLVPVSSSSVFYDVPVTIGSHPHLPLHGRDPVGHSDVTSLKISVKDELTRRWGRRDWGQG